MTLVSSPVRGVAPAPAGTRAQTQRLLVLAVSGRDHGTAARWLARWIAPGDRVHVVNVYEPLLPGVCWWEPVVREGNERALAAQRLVAQNEVPIRVTGIAAEVGGSAIGGDPVDILTQLSTVADTLVLGADGAGRDITHQVIAAAKCRTVVLPAGYQYEQGAGLPVTALLPDPDIPAAVLHAALDEARRHGVLLRVVQLATALRHHTGPRELLADQQVELSEALLPLRETAPEVPVVGEIDLEEPILAVTRAAQDSRMLVVTASSAGVLERYGGFEQCAVLLVPDGT